ncbi:MAG TPA: hypothetical protein VHE35_20990, partial [Kofleriaceae bacterium]|nr:hypothetical protein [Kofleriaceae bacterium]
MTRTIRQLAFVCLLAFGLLVAGPLIVRAIAGGFGLARGDDAGELDAGPVDAPPAPTVATAPAPDHATMAPAADSPPAPKVAAPAVSRTAKIGAVVVLAVHALLDLALSFWPAITGVAWLAWLGRWRWQAIVATVVAVTGTAIGTGDLSVA